MASHHSPRAPPSTSSSALANPIPEFNDNLDISQIPSDTQAAIEYLLAQLDPRRVREHKVFPKVCMIHQVYSIVKDHTTVDRTLDQLIKDGIVRKFFIGGTGSDEFAIMLTMDYVQQIEDAKAQYLKEVANSLTAGARGSKRKAAPAVSESEQKKKVMRISTRQKNSATATTTIDTTLGHVGVNVSTKADLPSFLSEEHDTVFDRFKELVTGGEHLEVMIQHSTLQHAINVTDADITLLIRYGLLNRMLAVPANPHLVNMTRTTNRGAGGASGGTSASEAEASSLRAAHQTIATLRASRSAASGISGTAGAAVAVSSGPVQATGGGKKVSSSSSSSTSSFSKDGLSVQAAGSRGEQVSDEIFYRFAIRQGGLFVTHFLKGRQEMLRTIKRKPFGDMLVSAIKAKSLRGSSLPHEFHILDLVGSARVRSMETTSGQLLKITPKGEASARAGG